MADFELVECWIRQAEEDLEAAKAEAEGISENHRRYWFQQSYERAVKAFGLLKYQPGAQEGNLVNRVFLHRHDPLLRLGQEQVPQLPRGLRLLRREVIAFVDRQDQSEFLRKIDATTATTDISEVSYRYPFLDDGVPTYPSQYVGWDTYQGGAMAVRSSLERLIRSVRDEFRIAKRRPR